MGYCLTFVEETIRQIFSEHFKEVSVGDIFIQPDEDSDDDPVLRITICIEAGAADIKKLVEFVRHLRSRIDEFFIVNFISKTDAFKIKVRVT